MQACIHTYRKHGVCPRSGLTITIVFVSLPRRPQHAQEDRKWGLWVQGLFEEPKYPYIYFSLHTEDDARVLMEVDERDPETGRRRRALQPLFGGVGVPGRRLDFRFDHRREQGRVLLSEGQVSFREEEMQKVDPLGIGGAVNVGDVVEAGAAALTPVLSTS